MFLASLQNTAQVHSLIALCSTPMPSLVEVIPPPLLQNVVCIAPKNKLTTKSSPNKKNTHIYQWMILNGTFKHIQTVKSPGSRYSNSQCINHSSGHDNI